MPLCPGRGKLRFDLCPLRFRSGLCLLFRSQSRCLRLCGFLCLLKIGSDGVSSYTRPGKQITDIGLEGWEPLGRTSHVKGHRDCTTMAFDLHVLGSSRLRVDGRTFVKMAK